MKINTRHWTKMVRKIFRVLFLLALLAASLVVFTWLRLADIIATAKLKLPAHYNIAYQYHLLDTKGSLVLTDFKLFHSGHGLILAADKLTLQPNELSDYLELEDNINLMQLPVKSTLSLTGINIPIEFLANSLAEPTDLRLVQLQTLNCGLKTDFTLDDLLENGLKSLTGDSRLTIEYNSLDARLNIDLMVNILELGRFEMLYEFKNYIVNSSQEPYLTQGQITAIYPKWVTIRNRYCAEQNGQSIDQYVAEYLKTFNQLFLDNQVKLKQTFLQRYNQFLLMPENISIFMRPKTGITSNYNDSLTYQTILQELGISVTINGRAIDNLIEEAKQPIRNDAVKKRVFKPILPKKKIVLSQPNEEQIKPYVEKYIDVIDKNDKEYQGQLLKVDEGTIVMSYRMLGGSATKYLKLEEIKQITILD
ncbi:MAG: hypothetical protein V2I33_01600 [Kangiellaceae bacterium]|jgi:hypothetical protein|nr:hypothetical protein [Kangiellaceae bacterium]